ncbi:MAG: ribonuclease P protein component [Defluviitaleaceae bacterium]|nr:ribonuclease P protein component [Defluviitaleaceae bacterium]
MADSLRKNRDFSQVYGRGRSFANRQLVLYALPNGLEKSRIGISVSKKIGNAVVRNRAKRLVKEACRHIAPKIPKSHDLVFIARAGIVGMKMYEVADSISHLISKQVISKQGAKL